MAFIQSVNKQAASEAAQQLVEDVLQLADQIEAIEGEPTSLGPGFSIGTRFEVFDALYHRRISNLHWLLDYINGQLGLNYSMCGTAADR